MPNPAGMAEIIERYLWDTVELPAAATQQLRFFQGAPATLAVGNVNQGMLESPSQALVWAVGVQWPEDTTGADANLITSGALRFILNSKNYFEGRIRNCPAGGAHVARAQAVAADSGCNGLESIEAMNWFTHPILIESTRRFEVLLDWGAGVTLATKKDITVVLATEFMRDVR